MSSSGPAVRRLCLSCDSCCSKRYFIVYNKRSYLSRSHLLPDLLLYFKNFTTIICIVSLPTSKVGVSSTVARILCQQFMFLHTTVMSKVDI